MERTDKQTEEIVIAHLIRDVTAWDTLSQYLSEDSFDDQQCKTFFKAIRYYRTSGKVPDLAFLLSVFEAKQRVRDKDELKRIVETAPPSADYMQQVDILENLRKHRAIYQMALDILDSNDADSGTLIKTIGEYMEDIERNTSSKMLDKYSLMQQAVDIINSNLDPNRQHKEVMTGFRLLDNMGGLPPGTEVVVAAFSSQGKTAWALSVINHAMKMGTNTAIYSMEMGSASLASRFLNMMGWCVPTIKFKTQQLMDNTIASFNELANEFVNRSGNVFIDESSNNNVDNICASIRMLHRTQGIQLVLVDYLQIIPVYDNGNDSDQEQLAKISRKLQATARQLDICIMVLSQFSRPLKGSGHQPTEDLIRGSGQIFEACDISIYVYRPEKWQEQYPAPFQDAETKCTAMIKIGKYRDGESDVSRIVAFDGSRTLFYDFAEGMYDEREMFNYPKQSIAAAQDSKDNDPFDVSSAPSYL